MLFKIQKRLLCIKSVIDFCEYTNNVLKVKGWMFSSKYQIQNIKVIMQQSMRLKYLLIGMENVLIYRKSYIHHYLKSIIPRIILQNPVSIPLQTKYIEAIRKRLKCYSIKLLMNVQAIIYFLKRLRSIYGIRTEQKILIFQNQTIEHLIFSQLSIWYFINLSKCH